MEHLIVPIDGSRASWRAAEVAVALARKSDSRIDLIEVIPDPKETGAALSLLSDGIARLDAVDVDITPRVEVTGDSVAGALGTLLERSPEATIVMASHGRGRRAAVLGSVTEELLVSEFGPLVVVGPALADDDAHVGHIGSGPLIVTVDGSDMAESALPLAAAWSIELGVTPWVIEVLAPDQPTDEHRLESSYPSRLARGLRSSSGHAVEFEVLHDKDVAGAVTNFAREMNASMIVAATHGRTGLARFTMGSTAADFVRHAPCPVLLARPPHLAEE